MFSRTTNEDRVEINRQLLEHIEAQDQKIRVLQLEALERNAEISRLLVKIAEQSSGDKQDEPGDSDEN